MFILCTFSIEWRINEYFYVLSKAAKLKRENCELTQKVSSSSQEARENLEAHEKQRSRADKLSDQMLVFKKKAKLEEEVSSYPSREGFYSILIIIYSIILNIR